MNKKKELVVYINNEYFPESEAKISIFDHAFLYGDGVFDTCCALNGRIFKLDEHIDRLFASARAIRLEIPLHKDKLKKAVIETVKRNNLKDAYIKIIVTRGVGGPILDPRTCKKPNIIIFTKPYLQLIKSEKAKKGIKAITSTYRRTPFVCLDPKIKCLNYLNLILMKLEAIEKGAEDAICLDIDGYVCEAPGFNVFIVKNNEIYTPPPTNILVGITRQIVIEIAEKIGIKVMEKNLTLYDAYNADEIFICGTAGGIIGVTELDGIKIGKGNVGQITKKISSLYFKLLESGEQSTPIYE